MFAGFWRGGWWTSKFWRGWWWRRVVTSSDVGACSAPVPALLFLAVGLRDDCDVQALVVPGSTFIKPQKIINLTQIFVMFR